MPGPQGTTEALDTLVQCILECLAHVNPGLVLKIPQKHLHLKVSLIIIKVSYTQYTCI